MTMGSIISLDPLRPAGETAIAMANSGTRLAPD